MRKLLLNAIPASAFTTALRMDIEPIPIEDAVQFITDGSWESYIGHPATAELLSRLTGQEVPVNRGQAVFQPGDVVLVAGLKVRLSEGQVITDPQELAQMMQFHLIKIS